MKKLPILSKNGLSYYGKQLNKCCKIFIRENILQSKSYLQNIFKVDKLRKHMAKYNSKSKQGKCIFCEIASNRIKPLGDGKFWENEKYIAFLSPFPNTPGFTVLIPKKHYASDVLQMPDEELKDFIIEAKRVSSHLIDRLDDVGRVGLIMEGTGIDHAHIKLVPLHGTGYMKKGEWRQVHSNVQTFFDSYLGYISSHDGPKADEEMIRNLVAKLR